MRPEDEGRLRFVEFAQHRWAHCHFPRAGSWSARTLAASLSGGEYRQPNDQTRGQLEALKARGWLISWFVREPVQRFLSVYQHFATRPRAMSAAMHAANSDGRLFESVDIFAERAFNEFAWDKHIARQTGWGAECAHIIAPLHRSDETRLPVKLPRINATASSFCDDIPAIIPLFYADDIHYWEKVCDAFNPEDVQASRAHLEGEARWSSEVVRSN